jgi:hypothetical protein
MMTGSRAVGAVVTLVLLLGACGSGDADGVAVRDASGTVVSAGAWSVFDLRPGDCIGEVSAVGGDVDELPLVPWWTARFRYGPFEWLWRWGTYGLRPRMRA